MSAFTGWNLNSATPDGSMTGAPFPAVFLDAATLNQPQTIRDCIRLSHFLYRRVGCVGQAFERILSYFLTDVEISDAGEDEKKKWEKFLREDLNIYAILQCVFRDRFANGTSVTSLLVPFERWLICRGCWRHAVPLREVWTNPEYRKEWSIPNFTAHCPHCKRKGKWQVDDRLDTDEQRLTVKRWDPLELEPLHDPYTEDVRWIWRIPEDYKRLLRQGHLFHLERAPEKVLQAVSQDFVYRFSKDAVFEMREPSLATDRNRGWGIPRIYQHFSQIYQERALNRQNEAIALDWVTPMRVLTPAPRPGGQGIAGGMTADPLHSLSGGDMRSQLMGIVRGHRRDPNRWHTLPFPVEYQTLGGDASKFAPVDLLNQARETLLNDIGTPVELFKGTLQLQVAPVALRLFESHWTHLLQDANRFLRWLVKQICDLLSWEQVTVTLRRVTISDDLQKQMAVLQMYMGQQVSGQTALDMLGLKWRREQEQIAEESRTQTEIKSKLEEEIQQAGFAQSIAQGQPQGGPGGQPGVGGQPGQAQPGQQGGGQGSAPGGAPGGGQQLFGTPVTTYLQSKNPNAQVTPQQQLADAQQLAGELLSQPQSVRRGELQKLQSADPNLWSIVKAQMEKERSGVKSQAGAQAMQQTYGQA